MPTVIHDLDVSPLNGNGKTDYRALAAILADFSVRKKMNNTIRQLILEGLQPKLGNVVSVIDDHANLGEFASIDSTDLLNVILLVEEQTGLEFTAEGLDLEEGVTLAQLVNAFPA